MAKIQKTREKPDRYFGLLNNNGSSISKHVQRLPKATRSRMSPFSNAENKCVLPFLISEAKSSTSGKSQGEIELQVFFQIRAMLLAQNMLATKPGGDVAAFDPLVWAVTYAGDRVHIFAAGLRWRQLKRYSKSRLCTVVFPHSTLQSFDVNN